MRAPAAWIALAVLACAGCGSDVRTPPEQQGTPVELPTSDWQPGDEMMFAQVTGVLGLNAQGCVAFEDTRTPLLWPEGFTAYRHDGELTLYGPEGDVVATGGDTIQSAGGQVPVDESAIPSECLSPNGQMVAIQGEVRVVGD